MVKLSREGRETGEGICSPVLRDWQMYDDEFLRHFFWTNHFAKHKVKIMKRDRRHHTSCIVSNIAVLSLLLGGLLGCSETQTRSAWSSRDAWFHPPVEWSRFQQAQSLPDLDVVEVTPDRMAAAERQLRYVTCAEISSQRAAELTGQSMEPNAGGSLFLVRGVYLNRGTGKFMVVFVGRELLVEHGSLGHSAVPMKRQVLVVRLPQKPEVVYVSCSMDE